MRSPLALRINKDAKNSKQRRSGDDVVAVGVKLDVDVEGKESCAHTPDVGSQRAPTYVLSFWDIKDEALSDAKAK